MADKAEVKAVKNSKDVDGQPSACSEASLDTSAVVPRSPTIRQP